MHVDQPISVSDVEEIDRPAASRILATLIEASPLAIVTFDPEGVVTMWNPAAERIFGWTENEALGSRLPFVPAERQEEFLGHRRRALLGEVFTEPELHRRRADGSPIVVSVSTSPLRRPDGTIYGIMSILMDVTEAKAVEESRARLTMAVEQAGESIVVTDTRGTIQYVNPAFERITGYDRVEVIGQTPRILKSGRHDAAFYKNMWETLRRGEIWRGTFLDKRKDGTLFEEDAVISPVRDPSGQVVNYVAVKRDVTDVRRMEEQLRQSQKMEAVGRLAGGVAHDFNNLLTAISGYSDLLLHRLPEYSTLRRDVEEIRKAGDRAAALTRQLLAFSRRQVLQPKVLDLNRVVTKMGRMLRRLVGEEIALSIDLSPSLSRVKADPGQIEQVIVNLALNARDAMPDGGRITIATADAELSPAYAVVHPDVHPGPYVLLSMADTGHGMDDETQTHLFEPFFTTKERGKGTGLGLATVYGIVQQSGGHIRVNSAADSGSTFLIYLPRVEAPEDAGQEAVRPPLPHPSPGTETVLLAEDEEVVRRFAREILSGNGYKVLEAGNGREALLLSEAHRGEIHLLLTDVVMPKIGGRELADRIRTLRPELRILYMSGYTDDAILRDRVLEDGIPFLQKPFTPEGLARKVREVLDTACPLPGFPVPVR
jgi:PAS domain S-box-containing protein